MADRTADADYHYTDPDSASTDYTIDRKTSIATSEQAEDVVDCIAEFDRIPSRYVTKYYNALLIAGPSTAFDNLVAKMTSKESDTRATNAAAIRAGVVRSTDWIN